MAVRFAYLGVPGFVLKGERVWLDCAYDLEQDELYSVKWYKDNVEFYRYLPSDTPSAQMYKLDGVFLDLHSSNATHAHLYTSELESEGTYGCEVSTEVPSFRTIKAEKTMHVYVIPKEDPIIYGVSNNYGIGSEVNATCVYGPSKPAAELTWHINGEKAPNSYTHEPKEDGYPGELQISESRLNFVIEPSHLWQGVLSIECTASFALVYSNSSRELIVSDGISGAEFQHVPHVPPGHEGPSITGSKRGYLVGDLVDVNCTSARSSEPAQLQWYVNDEEVKAEFLAEYRPVLYPDGLSSTKLGLQFRVQREHFKGEEMRLKCTSALSKVLKKNSEILISGSYQRSSGLQVADNSESDFKRMSGSKPEKRGSTWDEDSSSHAMEAFDGVQEIIVEFLKEDYNMLSI
ncbi:synaptogenesis protein syg-2-like [Uloborus diversus]|uniref:synaptogenesis protein syg-2-like n=1 Tax=Uloborus diversus TaxID=327109 RepID=UPI00240992F1|nr:synaptogenesis protein syg-2-like [Uloborus diversus]